MLKLFRDLLGGLCKFSEMRLASLQSNNHFICVVCVSISFECQSILVKPAVTILTIEQLLSRKKTLYSYETYWLSHVLLVIS